MYGFVPSWKPSERQGLLLWRDSYHLMQPRGLKIKKDQWVPKQPTFKVIIKVDKFNTSSGSKFFVNCKIILISMHVFLKCKIWAPIEEVPVTLCIKKKRVKSNNIKYHFSQFETYLMQTIELRCSHAHKKYFKHQIKFRSTVLKWSNGSYSKNFKIPFTSFLAFNTNSIIILNTSALEKNHQHEEECTSTQKGLLQRSLNNYALW